MAGEPAQIGPYQIGKRIGQGGMGAVYEAVHETIGRRAAVKFLNAGLARHPSTLNRFFNEARAVSLVEHPGLVQIYDSGQLPDGPAYIIMELIRGETLGDRLKRERRLPLVQTLRLGWQMADTLAAVHEKEIVHRGLMPRRERHRFFSLESLSLGKLGKRARGGQSRASTFTVPATA